MSYQDEEAATGRMAMALQLAKQKEPVLSRESIRESVNLATGCGMPRAKMAVKAAIVQYMIDLLVAGANPSQALSAICTRFELKRKNGYRYLQLAKRTMMRSMGVSPPEMRAWAGQMYLAIYADRSQTGLARVRALGEFCKLYGLNRPERVQLDVSGGITFEEVVQIVEGQRATPVIGLAQIQKALASASEDPNVIDIENLDDDDLDTDDEVLDDDSDFGEEE